MKDELEFLIRSKEQELENYKNSSRNFPHELKKRFSLNYIRMLEQQLSDLKEQKRKRDEL
jgi:hypothetical protein